MKRPTKKQLLDLMKKHGWSKQAVADAKGVHEKTIRSWCRGLNLDVPFEKKKAVLAYESVNVLPKSIIKGKSLVVKRVAKGVTRRSIGPAEESRRVFAFSFNVLESTTIFNSLNLTPLFYNPSHL